MSAKIMIVEDEPAIQELLEFNVTQAGFQVLCADDADSVWRHLDEGVPDLILLDWMLPDGTGNMNSRYLTDRAACRTHAAQHSG